MEYWDWRAIKAGTNRRAHTNKTSLIATIKENFAILGRDMVNRPSGGSAVDGLIEIGGDFIK